MPEYTRHEPGAFSWADLSTNDVDAAVSLYGELFGWEIEKQDLPDGGVYAMARIGGKDVAAISPLQDEQAKMGIPPHWNVYIAVDDAEIAAKEAERLGGTIVAPAFDVLESGRMAVVTDPTGAAIGFWQAKDSIGAQIYAEEGTIIWWELMTPDQKRATDFYTQLFGYGTQEQDTPSGKFIVLTHKGEQAAGIITPPQQGPPPAWTPYFAVTDAEVTLEKAKELGATEMMPVTEAQDVGWFSWITDPQGAVVAFIEPALR
jgi:predicted enzyme related to lactoylglutathione lyase